VYVEESQNEDNKAHDLANLERNAEVVGAKTSLLRLTDVAGDPGGTCVAAPKMFLKHAVCRVRRAHFLCGGGETGLFCYRPTMAF
jgi:hypothetical protein